MSCGTISRSTLPRCTSNASSRVSRFTFDRVLANGTTQEEVFGCVGEDMAESVLEGFNGTIMAYGQTGAGKTYTTTGGESYESRGLAARLVHHLFSHPGVTSSGAEISVSYVEVYNEHLYDLLLPPDQEHSPPLSIAEEEDLYADGAHVVAVKGDACVTCPLAWRLVGICHGHLTHLSAPFLRPLAACVPL